MRFQKAELCSAVIPRGVRRTTFPPGVDAPAFPRLLSFASVGAIAAIAALHPPQWTLAHTGDAGIWIGRAFYYWSSVILESAPFVVAGTVAAAATKRHLHGRAAAPFVAALFPGCDCSLNGFASALSACAPAIAGFSLTWGAVASPAALVATHFALGDRVVAGRVAGAAVAATLTAVAWCAARANGAPRSSDDCRDGSTSSDMSAAIGALALTGAVATIAAMSPWSLHPLSHAPSAALAGALLSPCSTADAVIARVLVHDRGAQAAFVVAAQCLDVRQLSVLARHFGPMRTALAAFAGCAGCFAAWMVAR
jgi:hypothetical protein